MSIGIKSPIADRVRQIGQAADQVKSGDTAGGLEFALVSPVITGTAIINKTKQSDESINLKISVRYNLSDEFGDVYGTREAQKKLWKKLGLKDMPQLIPSEYGTPYGMLGPSETDEIFSQRFKSEKEYLNFLKGKN